MRSMPLGTALLLLLGSAPAASALQGDTQQGKQQDGAKTIKATPLISPKAVQEAQQDANQDQDRVDESIEGRFDKITSEYNRAMREFSTAYNAAENDEQRSKILQESYPQPAAFAGKLLELGREAPSDPGAFKAFMWIVQRAGNAPEAGEAMDLLLEHHSSSEELGSVAMSLVYSQASPETEGIFDRLIQESPHKNVKGMAAYAKAVYLQRAVGGFERLKANGARQVPNAGKEVASLFNHGTTTDGMSIENLFEDLVENYAEIPLYGSKTIGEAAEGALFEARYLSIGKVVPDISGEDIDGVTFNLSDYRGKVVMLDFWGDW